MLDIERDSMSKGQMCIEKNSVMLEIKKRILKTSRISII